MCLVNLQPPKKKIVRVADASSNAPVDLQMKPVVDDVEANQSAAGDGKGNSNSNTGEPRQRSQGLGQTSAGTARRQGWVSNSISAASNVAGTSIPQLSYHLVYSEVGGASVAGSNPPREPDILDADWKPKSKFTVDYYKSKTVAVEHARGIRLIFRGLFYSVPNPQQRGSEIALLKGVDGLVNPGEMCALMGASGAGKSTLLDVLAGRKTVGTITGDILFNGVPRSAHVMKAIAYVMQDNVHIGTLTVRQTLYYAAELRLSEKISRAKKDERINQIISMLGFDHVADTM